MTYSVPSLSPDCNPTPTIHDFRALSPAGSCRPQQMQFSWLHAYRSVTILPACYLQLHSMKRPILNFFLEFPVCSDLPPWNSISWASFRICVKGNSPTGGFRAAADFVRITMAIMPHCEKPRYEAGTSQDSGVINGQYRITVMFSSLRPRTLVKTTTVSFEVRSCARRQTHSRSQNHVSGELLFDRAHQRQRSSTQGKL